MGPPVKRGFDRGGFFRGSRGRGGWQGRGRGRGNFDHRLRRSRSRSPPSPPRRSRERSNKTAHDNNRSPTLHDKARPRSSDVEKSYDVDNRIGLGQVGGRNRQNDSAYAHNEKKERSRSSSRTRSNSKRSPSPSKPSISRHQQPNQTGVGTYYGNSMFNHEHHGGQVTQHQNLTIPSTGMPSQITPSLTGGRYSLPMVASVDDDPRLMQKSFQQKDTESLRITVDNDHYKNEKPSALDRLGPPVETQQEEHQQRSYDSVRNKDFNGSDEMDILSRGKRYDEKRNKKNDFRTRCSKSRSRSTSTSSRSRSLSPSITKKRSTTSARQGFKADYSGKHAEKKNSQKAKNDPILKISNSAVIENIDTSISKVSRKDQQNESENKQTFVQKFFNDLSNMEYSNSDVIEEESESLTVGFGEPSARPAKSILKRSTNPILTFHEPEADKQIKSILKNKVATTRDVPEVSSFSNIFSRNIEGSLPGLDLLDNTSGGNMKQTTERFGFPSIDDEEEFLYGNDEIENVQNKSEQSSTKDSTSTHYQLNTNEIEEKYVPQSTPSTLDLEKEESHLLNQPDFQNSQVQKILSAIGFDFDLAKKIQQQKGIATSSNMDEETCKDLKKTESGETESTKDAQVGMFDHSASFLSSGFDGNLETLMKVETADKTHKSNDNTTVLKPGDHGNSSGDGVPTSSLNYDYPHYGHPLPPVQYANYPAIFPQETSLRFGYPMAHPPGQGFSSVDMQHISLALPRTSIGHPLPPGHPSQFNSNPWRQQFPFNEYPPNYEYQQHQHTYGVEEDKKSIEILREKSHGKYNDKARKHKRKLKRGDTSDDEEDNVDQRKRQKYTSDYSGSEDEKKVLKKGRPIGDIEKETNRRLGLIANRPAVVSTEYFSSEDEQDTLTDTQESVATDLSEKAKTIELDEDDERHAKKQAVLEVKEKFQEIAKHRSVTRKELEDEIEKKTVEILKRKKENSARNEELAEKKKKIQDEKEIYFRRMDMLEEELCRLRKQQSYLIRKRNYRKDEKDPVLMENTMLQDAIASQIHQLRKDYTEKKNNENKSSLPSTPRENLKSKRFLSSEPVKKHSSQERKERDNVSPQTQGTSTKCDRELKESRRSSKDSPKHVKRKSSPKQGDYREDRRRNRSVESREKNFVEDRQDDGKRNKDEKNKQRNQEQYSSQNKPKEKFQFEFSYFDPGSHFCKMCKISLAKLNEVFIHLHSKKHLQKCDPFDRPWMSDMNSNPRQISSSKMVAAPLKGVDFMMPVNGFYCKLCKQFFGDAACSAEHLKSIEHNKAYQKYIDENPLYEKELELMRAAALGDQEGDKADQTNMKVINKEGGFGKFAFKNEDCEKDVKQENTNKQSVSGLPIYEGPKLPPELQVRKSIDIFHKRTSEKDSAAEKRSEKKCQEHYLPGEGDIAAAFSGKTVHQTDNPKKQDNETRELSLPKSSCSVSHPVTTTSAASVNIHKPVFIGKMPGRKTVTKGRGKAKPETKITTADEKNKEAQQMAHIAKEMQAHMARAQLAAKQQIEKVQMEEVLAKSLKTAKEKTLEATKYDVANKRDTENTASSINQSGVLRKQLVPAVSPEVSLPQGVAPKEQSVPVPVSITQSTPGVEPTNKSPHANPTSNVLDEDLYSIDDMFMDDGTEIPGMEAFMATSSLDVKVKPPPPVNKVMNQPNSGSKATLTTSSKESIYGLFFSGK